MEVVHAHSAESGMSAHSSRVLLRHLGILATQFHNGTSKQTPRFVAARAVSVMIRPLPSQPLNGSDDAGGPYAPQLAALGDGSID